MIKTRLVGLLSHAKKYIGFNVLWQWFALLSQILAVFSIAELLERVVYRTLSTESLQRIILVLAVVLVVRFLCEKQAARASYLACVDVKRILRENIYGKLLRLGASYREQTSTSEVVQVCTEGVEQLETYFGKYLPQLFYSLLAPVTLFVVLCRVSLKASVVLLVCVPLIPVSIVVVQKIAKRLLNKYWSVYTGLGDSFLENLQGLTTLKIYQADAQKAREMDAESQKFRKITMKVLTMQLNSTSVMDIVAYGGAAVGMAVAVTQFMDGALSISGTVCIVLLASEFFIPLRLLGSFFHIAMNGMAASDKIFAILDLPEPEPGTEELPEGGARNVRTAADVENNMARAGVNSEGYAANTAADVESNMARAGVNTWGSFASTAADVESNMAKPSVNTWGYAANDGYDIEFRNVRFSYNEEREILKDINISLPKGSFISLVGESGCGKSTIAGLLCGKNRGYSGSITIAGKELSAIREGNLMRHVLIVRHNSYLFKGTVEENLRLARPDATEAELVSVLEQTNLWAFLAERDGLSTALAEQGGNLSGGQCQRLALARALLTDAEILIFDEATSNIDAESEEMIMEVIRGLAGTRTVLLISHRLQNVVGSDCIYMMRDGEIVERGTHAQLMRDGGSYAKLYKSQLELEGYALHGSGAPGDRRKNVSARADAWRTVRAKDSKSSGEGVLS